MQRPATLTRRSTDIMAPTPSRRPAHMLLKAVSYEGFSCEQAINARTANKSPASSRPSSSSSSSTTQCSIFDDDCDPSSSAAPYGSSYYGEYSDTDDDDEADVTTLDLSDSGFTCMPAQLLVETDCCMQIRSLIMSQNLLDGEQEDYLSEHIVLPNLSSLCLEDCNITTLEPLCKHLYAPNLRELNISNHRMQGAVPELQRYFPKLDTLIARKGSFDQLDDTVISGLTRIDLSGNCLTDEDGSLLQQCQQQGTELVL